MKKIIITILSIAAFVAGFIIFYQSRPAVQTPASNESQQSNNSKKLEAKTSDQTNVNMMVTSLDLSQQSSEWKFNVGMNTHSVELDQDMTKITVLVDDQGKEYAPTKWDGPVGGHHREGTLSFAPITPYPQHLTMKIKGIGGVDRSFSWILNK